MDPILTTDPVLDPIFLLWQRSSLKIWHPNGLAMPGTWHAAPMRSPISLWDDKFALSRWYFGAIRSGTSQRSKISVPIAVLRCLLDLCATENWSVAITVLSWGVQAVLQQCLASALPLFRLSVFSQFASAMGSFGSGRAIPPRRTRTKSILYFGRKVRNGPMAVVSFTYGVTTG